MINNNKQLKRDKQFKRLEREVTSLLKSLKLDIGDDYRASDDETRPSMCVTVGAKINEEGELSWNYQTGDNSFTGGAYGFPVWGVISLYRTSNSKELAVDIVDQIAEQIAN